MVATATDDGGCNGGATRLNRRQRRRRLGLRGGGARRDGRLRQRRRRVEESSGVLLKEQGGGGEGPRLPATRRKDRGKQIRSKLESAYFQRKLDKDSKREKVEEIEKIISPLSIRPEKERRGRIWKETAAACARVSGGGGARRTTGPTDGPQLSAAERERRAAARRTGPAGPTGPGRERERERVLGRLSAQSQKRLLKPFSI
uniref:Uncharacterized protein n=1 Tax=Oryza nivara TaxID=4536 RepID=A0A679BDD9_ORYNI|nr:hypothetical protein [Oryza sativa f. spontanea]